MALPNAEQLQAAANAVLQRGTRPDVGVVLGSGLGGFGATLDDAVCIPYREIPNMPSPRVEGHAGNLWLGRSGGSAGAAVACLQGRVHAYEGHPLEQVCFGVCLLAELGCTAVILTNAAGGIDPHHAPGDLMLITDHINLTGQNPLTGPHDGRGPRFIDMTQAYDPELCQLARHAATAHRLTLKEGIYAGLSGPSYETPAEIRLLRTLGAHAVGMSTVPEVLALRALGVRVGAISCIANLAAGMTSEPLRHDDVQQAAAQAAASFEALLHAWLKSISSIR